MKKWYQSTLAKAVLLFLAVTVTAAAFVSLAIVANCSGDFSIQDFFSGEEKVYEETNGFENNLQQSVYAILSIEFSKDNLETEGEYDPDKLVDIMEYAKNSVVTGENKTGLAYRVEDLISWYNSINGDVYANKNNNIIVCQRPDGTYYYYYRGEFKKLLEDGELKLELDEEYSTTAFLEELNNGYYNESGQFSGNILIKDKEGETLYTDCWAFTESLDELAAPDGAKNILEIVNQTEKYNGKLSEVYNNLDFALQSVNELKWSYDDVSRNGTFLEGNTNLFYYLLNKESGKIYTNNSAYSKEKKTEKVIEELKQQKNMKYIVVQPKLKDFESNMEASASIWKEMIGNQTIVGDDYVFVVAIDTKYPIQDMFYENAEQFNKYAPFYSASIGCFVGSIIIFCICIIWLTIIAGRSADANELKIYAFDRWKTEIVAAIIIGIWVLLTMVAAQATQITHDQYYDIYGYGYYISSFVDTTEIIMIGIYGLLTAVLFLIGYLSLIRRIKARTLWKDSLCRICVRITWKCCKALGMFWKKRNVLWKMVLAIVVFYFFHWIAFAGEGVLVFIMFLAEAAVAFWILWEALCKERIRKGIRKISEGDVSHQISTDKMHGVNKEIAENVNHIGDGLQEAVNESMKSERLKTDLITNVSHDIKTPLTSIINYVDLLKRENIEDPKIQGYIKVLEEKSQRLKTLTEDVVEASKVSSGNISLEYMDVNFVEMLNQTIGEFSEKFEMKKLQIIENVPEEAVVIHVDNRRVWRILENIFNNAAKYSMTGTRVYADLKKEKKRVIFSLKNISEQPLNIQAEELTERFIRGDISRSTEGSGLGLSIAKNLTELQGGKFNLYLDGDLFKVTIEFPIK